MHLGLIRFLQLREKYGANSTVCILLKSLYKQVSFQLVLKEVTDWDFLIERGRLFQILGAAQENARSPRVTLVLQVGNLRSNVSFELRRL